MAKAHEESWVSVPEDKYAEGYYSKHLGNMQQDNEWSYPAYIMLSAWWNDALDWADGMQDDIDLEDNIKPAVLPRG